MKILTITSFLCFVIITHSARAQIDNLANLSAEWSRIGTRNAATDGTDIMVYNPGGMSRIGDGIHINLGNQSFVRKPSHEYNLGFGNEFKEQDGNDLFVPNLYLSYNRDKWAYFGGFYIAGGGATADFPLGSITTDLIALSAIPGINAAIGSDYSSSTSSLEASSYYLTATVGVAYSFNDKISAGLMVRQLFASNKTNAKIVLSGSALGFPDAPLAFETEDDASGTGVVIGLDYQPIPSLNLAVRYESRVKLDFDTNEIQDDLGLVVDGEKNRRDLPAVAGFGVSYKINEQVSAMFDFNHYFQTNANWGPAEPALFPDTDLSDLAGNSTTYALGLEITIFDVLTVSAGSIYSVLSFNDVDGYYTHLGAFETAFNTNFTINGGFSYQVNDKAKLTFGYFRTFYENDEPIQVLLALPFDVNATVNNKISSFALSLDFTL